MHIYKRGKFYCYEFYWRGERIRRSTAQGDKAAARDIMAAHRSALARGETFGPDRQRLTLLEFVEHHFLPYAAQKHAQKPATLRYYKLGAQALVAVLDDVELGQITDQHAQQFAARRSHLSASSVNCGLRTLRRLLHLAVKWGKLDRMPEISLATGERQRDRVLDDVEVATYLRACEQPWRDAATIMLGTGCRPSEVFALRWENVQLNGGGGLLQITQGKSRAAKRMLPLVQAVYGVLSRRQAERNGSEWVFPSRSASGHLEGTSAKNQHSVALRISGLAAFPPYTLRHTALTRLAEAGCDAHTLARIAGHSSILITQRYVHPQQDAVERAFAALPAGGVAQTVN